MARPEVSKSSKQSGIHPHITVVFRMKSGRLYDILQNTPNLEHLYNIISERLDDRRAVYHMHVELPTGKRVA